MDCVNAYLIQETIRQKDCVSVPWIQGEYKLGYGEATEFLKHLKRRGWIEPIPRGIQYPVVQGSFYLRKIAREEVSGLIEDITPDCITALMCMQKEEGMGASYPKLLAALRGDDDTDEAVKILLKHDLIFLINGLYFATVSRKTVSVLSDVVRRKRRNEAHRRMSGKPEDNTHLVKMFDILFDD